MVRLDYNIQYYMYSIILYIEGVSPKRGLRDHFLYMYRLPKYLCVVTFFSFMTITCNNAIHTLDLQ